MFIKHRELSAVPKGYLAEKSYGSETAILKYKGF